MSWVPGAMMSVFREIVVVMFFGLGLTLGGVLWLYSFSLSRNKKWLKRLAFGWFFISWIWAFFLVRAYFIKRFSN